MHKPIETLAEGLGHPEGPDVLPDGRIVMVETYTGKIVAWSAERGLHDYALCGGGQRLHRRLGRGGLHHPERRHGRGLEGGCDGRALHPEGLARRKR